MKTILKILFVVIALTTFNSNAQKNVQKAIIKTAINCDHCKKCETCGDVLEKTLLKEKGIQMITLDEQAMTITVIYNTRKTDLIVIKNAISQLGYDADDVKADPASYEKLDRCCKV